MPAKTRIQNFLSFFLVEIPGISSVRRHNPSLHAAHHLLDRIAATLVPGMIRRSRSRQPFRNRGPERRRRGALAEPEAGCLMMRNLPRGRSGQPRGFPWPLGIRGRLSAFWFSLQRSLSLSVAWINLEHRFSDQSLQARQHALTLARMASNRVDDHIRSVDALLLAIGNIISANNSDADFNYRFLRTIQKDLPPFFSSLGVFAPDGQGLEPPCFP